MPKKDESFKKALKQEKDMQGELKKPELLFNIIKEAQKDGVVGNEYTMLALIMKIMLRLVCDARAESSNMVVSDESGGGKDFITETICRIMLPANCYLHRTGLTPTVFTYWHTDKKSQEEGFSWNDKVIHAEDPKEDLLNCSGFKTMASGGSENTVTKDQKAVDYNVIGKPILIVTSLKACIDIEGVRRWDSVNVEISKEITNAVIKRNILKQKRDTLYEINKPLRDGLKRLSNKCVVVPFADDIIGVFSSRLVNRTLSKVFMDYISASAVLHQYQREKDKDGNIIATWFDYDYAAFVFNTCSTRSGVMLNKIEKEFIEILDRNNEALTIREIVAQFSRSRDWIYNNMERLKSLDIIGEFSEWDARANKDVTKLYSKENFTHAGEIRSSHAVIGRRSDRRQPNKDQLLQEKINFEPEKSGRRGFYENVLYNIDNNRRKEGLSIIISNISVITTTTTKKGNSNGRDWFSQE